MVAALTHVAEGKICGNVIRNYIPVRSDSLYSASSASSSSIEDDDDEEELSEDEIMKNTEDGSESVHTDSTISNMISPTNLELPNYPTSPPLRMDATLFDMVITVQENHDKSTMDTQVDGMISSDSMADHMEA